MNIRVATLNDINLVLSIGFEFLKESPYKDMTPDPVDAAAWVSGLIQTGIVLIADEDSTLCGSTLKLPFATEMISAEVAWGSRKKGRDRAKAEKLLLEAFEYWSRNVAKVQYIQVGSFHGEKFFLRRGYKKYETLFMVKL